LDIFVCLTFFFCAGYEHNVTQKKQAGETPQHEGKAVWSLPSYPGLWELGLSLFTKLCLATLTACAHVAIFKGQFAGRLRQACREMVLVS
jgi:hypothetical protein